MLEQEKEEIELNNPRSILIWHTSWHRMSHIHHSYHFKNY